MGGSYTWRNGGLNKNRWVPVTYRGDNSTSKYHTHKKFPENKMGVKWIHSNGYSRPDKRTLKKGGTKKK